MKLERCCVKDVSCVQKVIILLVDLQKALFGIETQITEKNYLLGGSIYMTSFFNKLFVTTIIDF